MKKYISDVIDMGKIKPGQFNLITGGCGSGKTTFVLEDLLNHFPDVKPAQMIIVTSRSITAEQMDHDHDGVTLYNNKNCDIVNYWADADHEVKNPGVRVMTYDKIIDILINKNIFGVKALGNIKILVFDECHTLFTDEFMAKLELIRIWLREAIFNRKDFVVIGVTATPASVDFINIHRAGLPIVHVMDENLITYKAKRMICTNFSGAIDLLRSKKLPGRNIVMCKRIEECRLIYDLIPDSCAVISKSHSGVTKQNDPFAYGKRNLLYLKYEQYMDYVRSYISEHSDIPREVLTDNGSRNVNTLATTSTFREGFNLFEKSGVKNVFVVASDEMQITQFLGRCRYDIENLVVVIPPREFRETTCCGYFTRQSELLYSFVRGDDNEWFGGIKKLVYGDVDSVEFYGDVKKRFNNSSGYSALKGKLSSGRMMDSIKNLLSTEDNKVYIWKGNHDDEIRSAASDYSILRGRHISAQSITLNKVMTVLKEYGYRVEVHPKLPDGTRRRCYCIYAD